MRHAASAVTERCASMLGTLADAAGLKRRRARMQRLFRTLCSLGNLDRPPSPPRWSGLTDDCTPIELSIAIKPAETRVRFLIEAQADPPSAASYWEVSGRLNRYLAEHLGACTKRLDQVADLFAPADPNALLAAWHSVEFAADWPPLSKIYLNPAARGPQHAHEVACVALARLGFGRASRSVIETLSGRDALTHLSLDLSNLSGARVKLYARHFGARVSDLRARAARLRLGDGGGFGDAARVLCCGTSFGLRPVMTCAHFNDADTARPHGMTLYVPLFPYCSSDAIACERVCALLRAFALPTHAYLEAYASLCTVAEPGAPSSGLHSYVSCRSDAQGQQVAIYFNPRLFQRNYGRLALDPQRFWPSAAAAPQAGCTALRAPRRGRRCGSTRRAAPTKGT